MSFILQSAVFPSFDLCSEESLYFRSSEKKILFDKSSNGLILSKSQRIDTNTYFNSFSIGKWVNKTGLTDVSLRLRFTGKVVLQLVCYKEGEQHVLLDSVPLFSDDFKVPLELPG